MGFAHGSGNILSDWQKILAKGFSPKGRPEGYETTREIAEHMGIPKQLAWARLSKLFDAGKVDRLKVIIDGKHCCAWKIKKG